MAHDPAYQYLPAGFPRPEAEAIAQLRRTIMEATRTPHPPEVGELAVIIAASEAGVDLTEIDPEAIWLEPSEIRGPLFALIGRLLAEMFAG
jgi:hypothetical protein